jgi:hypothetical protein
MSLIFFDFPMILGFKGDMGQRLVKKNLNRKASKQKKENMTVASLREQ